MSKKTPITKLSFEEAMTELETIVRSLETGKETLENSIDAYMRGTELKRYCEAKLTEARLKVEKITTNELGETAVEGFQEQ